MGKVGGSQHHRNVWDDLHVWSAAMVGYKLCRRDRQERRGSGLTLYTREGLDCLELQDGDDKVECLWVRIRGKENIPVFFFSCLLESPNQDEKAYEDFIKCAISQLLAAVVGDFNLLDVLLVIQLSRKKTV